MSSFDYAGLALEVKEVLAEFGRELTLRTVADGATYDPVTDTTVPGGDPIDYLFQGVTLAVDEGYATTVGTENIKVRDQLVYADALEHAPELEDAILIDGEYWQVVNVVPIKPAATAVLYIIQVRP